jgi:hypothetical protein
MAADDGAPDGGVSMLRSSAMLRLTAICLVLVGCKADQTSLADAGARGVGGMTTATTTTTARAPQLSCAALGGCVDACPSPATEACAAACAARLTAAARPFYDAMQACVVPACAALADASAPCHQPGSFSCNMCVLKSCAALASACLQH